MCLSFFDILCVHWVYKVLSVATAGVFVSMTWMLPCFCFSDSRRDPSLVHYKVPVGYESDLFVVGGCNMDRDEIRCDLGGGYSVSLDGKMCRGNIFDPSVSARDGLVCSCGSVQMKS